MSHDIEEIMRILRATSAQRKTPVVTEMAHMRRDPFRVLISTIISLRTKDEVTRYASERLFALADSPREMMSLDMEALEKAIFPAGFYKNKARTIKEISATLVEKYGGAVPDDLDELLTLKGVGRKTANLVLIEGFQKTGVCVDTHVHRITNRWGYVATKTPDETEFALRKKLPVEYHMEINELLVAFGQHVCKPISPLCSQCPLHNHCMRVGVTIHR